MLPSADRRVQKEEMEPGSETAASTSSLVRQPEQIGIVREKSELRNDSGNEDARLQAFRASSAV